MRSPLSVAGFDFSEVEPSALVQYQGGPCAVIAPVQAFLLQAYLEDCSASGAAACTFSEVCHAVDCASPAPLSLI